MPVLTRPALSSALVAFVFLASACGSPPPSAPAADATREEAPRATDGGTAVLGSTTDVDSWNEYLSRQDFAAKLHRRIFLRLAVEAAGTTGDPATFEPQLAESWSFSEDGRSLTFVLREATWSDGQPITAEDVRFTWQAQTDPAVAWTNAAVKRHVTRVDVVDPRTVTFRFDQRYAYQLGDAVEGGILPAHVFGAVPFERWREHDWSQVQVGSGPFVLEHHRPAEEIALARNPRYYLPGLPVLDRVVVRVVPDSANLLAQLAAGDIDYVEGLAPRDAHHLGDKRGVQVVAFDYPKYDFIGWNGARAPFDDPRVRRALTLAIDREALVEDLLYGHGRVGRGPVLSWSWAADATLEPWPHDPAQALRLLAEAGATTRADRGTTAASATPLEIELLTNAGNALREAAAVKIQEQLSRIGVRVHVRTLEMGALIERCSAGDYDAYIGGWTLLGNIDLRPVFGSASRPPHGVNVVAFRSPEVDRLLDEVDAAADWRAMKDPLDRIQHRIHEEQPYTFLYEARRIAAIGPRLGGLVIERPTDPLAGLERCRIRAS